MELTTTLRLCVLSVLLCLSGASFTSPEPRLWICGMAAGLDYGDVTGLAQHCVSVDVCEQQNQRGEALVRGDWTHRSATALRVDHDGSEGVLARYTIDVVRVPAGVVLELCEPDFAELRATGKYVCNVRTVQSVIGNCVGDSSAVNNTCWLIPDLPHTAQLARYSFDAAWGCYTSTAPGFTLSSPDVPNRQDACASVAHSTFTQNCDFECDPGYINTNGVCVHMCAGLQAVCAPLEYATHTCNAVGVEWYECAPCPLQTGSSVVVFDDRLAKSECTYTECVAGSFGVNGTCQPCAPHFHSAAGQSSCKPCVRGEFQPNAGRESCLPCFPAAITGACPAGHELYQNMTSIDSYFQLAYGSTLQRSVPQDAALLLSYCAKGYACLPCRPGHYELQHEEGDVFRRSAECIACPIGKYQPYFEATACFDCAIGQTTVDVGSTSRGECLCEPGFH